MKIKISNISIARDHLIDGILGICGLAQCFQFEDMISGYVDLCRYKLDEQGRKEFYNMVSKFHQDGFTVEITF
jgi:hypothetical protein